MTTATKEQLVVAAQTLLNTAIEFLELATKDDANAQAYMVDHLKIAASKDHGFLSSSLTLDHLIERYEKDEEEIEVESHLENVLEQIQDWS